MFSKTINIELPAPHAAQQRVIDEAKRFNVVCCGRRWGKTVLGMDRLIQAAIQGNPVAWMSPTYKLESNTWRELCSGLAPIIRDKSEQEKRIALTYNGGVIDLWSLDTSDAARGRKYALVIVDEAALVPNLGQAWESIRPTLTDMAGGAWFLSTPRGMNYFKILYDWGQDPTRRDWASWQMPTSANPIIPAAEIEAARRDMTEAAFNQEYQAMFVSSEGSVFRNVEDVTTEVPNGPEANHEYVIGGDWGRSHDYTVFVVLDTTRGTVVAVDRSNRVDYAVQCDRLRALRERWRAAEIIVESNSVGQPIIEQLERDGLSVQPFLTTNVSKARAIEALALAFERREISIPDDSVLKTELVAYQAERLPSGQTRYTAPVGQHDDCVMALAMAWTEVSQKDRLIYTVPDSAILVEPFEIPKHWPRAYGVDIQANTAGVVWGALDRESDTLYLYQEYLADADISVHVEAIRRSGYLEGFIEAIAHGREREDGYRMIEMYGEHGLKWTSVQAPLESGIADIVQRMKTGRLKVFNSLPKFLRQRRHYRRDDKKAVIGEDDALLNALRCLARGIPEMHPSQPCRGGSFGFSPIRGDGFDWMK